MKVKKQLIALALLSFLSGCAVKLAPRDLAFDSIYLVNNPFARTDRALFKINSSTISEAGVKASHIAIVFSSAMNLFYFSEEHDFNIGYDISYCSTPGGMLPRIAGGGLYTKSGYWVGRSNDVFNGRDLDREIIEYNYHNHYHYIALLRTSGPGNRIGDSSTHYDASDLRNISSDLCVRLRGGAMWGYSLFRSNEFTVPRDLVMDVVRQNQGHLE